MRGVGGEKDEDVDREEDMESDVVEDEDVEEEGEASEILAGETSVVDVDGEERDFEEVGDDTGKKEVMVC